MANHKLFASNPGPNVPKADTVNEAGGSAYQLTSKQALAQYAATGTLNDTFYATDSQQLDHVLEYTKGCTTEFIAKTAIYSRQRAFMKDMPALLVGILAMRPDGDKYLQQTLSKVVDNGKMARNLIEILRSGRLGRKSIPRPVRRYLTAWLISREPEALIGDSVGQKPSLADVIKMLHPVPPTPQHEALWGYFLGHDTKAELLPGALTQYINWCENPHSEIPNVPFQMLTNRELDTETWTAIALHGSWHQTRMNLRTYQRHGVLTNPAAVSALAEKLRNPEMIRKARAYPYQLLMAYKAAATEIPRELVEALHDALEIATDNVPSLPGNIVVCPDVSGSMTSPVTGYRTGATTAATCVDVASLVTACILRKNPNTKVLPFDTQVHGTALDPRDSVMTNASILARFGGGGTACQLPLQLLNKKEAMVDLVVYISDNQSWVATSELVERSLHWTPASSKTQATETMAAWAKLKQRCPKAKMVSVDIQPYGTVQTPPGGDILHVGGWSDTVFDIISLFAEGKLSASHWVGEIEKVTL